uniref:Uncharacterized protein n=1 Tax=Haptolina ericina TaxID=156174 RepID=A0A7S3F292_9EUKA
MEADGVLKDVDLANHALDAPPSPGGGGVRSAGSLRVQARSGAVRVQTCASAFAMYQREAWESCAIADNVPLSNGVAPAAALASGDGFGGTSCERAQLHRCMADKGHGRLFILPSLAIRHSNPQQDMLYVLLTLAILLPALAPCIAFCKRRLMCQLLYARPHWAKSLGKGGVLPVTIGKRHVLIRRRLIIILIAVVLLQLGLLSCQLHKSATAALAAASPHSSSEGDVDPMATGAADEWSFLAVISVMLPLVLPCLTAIDLLRSKGGEHMDSLAFRVPTAALTVLVPLFVLLELRRLQSIELPLPPSESVRGSPGPLQAMQDLASWLRQPWPNSFGLCPSAPSGCGAHSA